LQSFIVHKESTDEFEWQKLSINDGLLEDIFNEHIPDGGSIDPILDMVEKATDVQIETGQYVHVNGESLDDYQIIQEDGGLYEMSMDPNIKVGEAEVNDYLSQVSS